MVSVHVLSVSSLKGGVGKTTVTLGLASAAFARGVRTLVVDLDPQSDVSTGMDIQVAGRLNIADVLANPKEKVVRQAITSSGWAKVHPGTIDVLIGSPSAINFDGPHPSVRDVWKLEEALAAVEADYDLVLVDCAPSLNALTRTAWAASDRVMVVTEPGLFSVAAADRALRAIEEIRRGLSPRLQPLGIVVNRVRPQSIEHQFRIKELRDMFGPLVLSPQLPERTSLQQAQVPPSRCTSGPATPHRNSPPTSTSCSTASSAPDASRFPKAVRRADDHPRAQRNGHPHRGWPLCVCPPRTQAERLLRRADSSSTGSGAVASNATRVDSTSRSTLPTAMPNTPCPRLTRSMTSSLDVQR